MKTSRKITPARFRVLERMLLLVGLSTLSYATGRLLVAEWYNDRGEIDHYVLMLLTGFVGLHAIFAGLAALYRGDE